MAPDLSGVTLDLRRYYEVTAPRDHGLFMRSLGELLPPDAVLYFEGVSIGPEAARLFSRYTSVHRLKIAKGTIWPRPRIFHVQHSKVFLENAALLLERHASPEICDHLHAYNHDGVLLQWHDAFFDDPFLLAGTFSATQVSDFCGRIGCNFARETSKPAAGDD